MLFPGTTPARSSPTSRRRPARRRRPRTRSSRRPARCALVAASRAGDRARRAGARRGRPGVHRRHEELVLRHGLGRDEEIRAHERRGPRFDRAICNGSSRCSRPESPLFSRPMAQSMRTLIKDGTVVTAVDTFSADVAIEDDKIAAIFGAGRRAARAVGHDDRRHGQVRHPRRHRRAHAPRHAVRRHDVGRRLRDRHASPRRTAARRRSSTSRSSTEGQLAARRRSTRGTRRPRARRAIDYGFHMIMTDVNDRRRSSEMDALVREGVTSFKLFMAYPGVFLLDDQQIFRAHAARRRARRAHLHARRERRCRSTCSSQQALAEGPHRADVSRAHAARRSPRRGHRPRDRARRDGRACRSTSSTSRRSARSSG